MHEKYSSHHNRIHQQGQNYFVTFQHLLTFPIISFDDFYFIFKQNLFFGLHQGESPRELTASHYSGTLLLLKTKCQLV